MTEPASPWMTRRQAADYLQVSVDTIDRNLAPWGPRPIAGRIRFARLALGAPNAAGFRAVRVYAQDVYDLLPSPAL